MNAVKNILLLAADCLCLVLLLCAVGSLALRHLG